MATLLTTGTVVAPGDVLCVEPLTGSATVGPDGVVAGPGTYVRLVEAGNGSGVERHVVSLRLGVVQWEASSVAVYVKTPVATASAPSAEAVNATVAGTAAASTVFGPRPGDTVHLRVTRLTRLAAAGEIIAVNGVWCAGSGRLSQQEAFRGIVRVEDIRPFKPSKDQLQPPPPSQAFQTGDVVTAEVISQSDARQYQLSTLPPRCGVVESAVSVGSYGADVKRRLEPIPGRRDAMLCAADGSVHYRWAPLLEL